MPRLVLPLVIAVLSLAAVPPAQAQAPPLAKPLPDPLGLRGINLGMTLAEVRKLGHPDKPAGKIELVCTGDEQERQVALVLDSFDKDYVAAGAKICGFHALDRDRIRSLPVDVGGHDATVRFFFTPKSAVPATSERLYTIDVSTSPRNFDSLVDSYKTKFGEPNDTVELDGKTLSWYGKKSTIQIEEYRMGELPGLLQSGRPIKDLTKGRTMMIQYSDEALLGAFLDEKAKSAKKSGADKL